MTDVGMAVTLKLLLAGAADPEGAEALILGAIERTRKHAVTMGYMQAAREVLEIMSDDVRTPAVALAAHLVDRSKFRKWYDGASDWPYPMGEE